MTESIDVFEPLDPGFKECSNFKILADLTGSRNIEETISKIREKSRNWNNIKKYDFLETLKIKDIKLYQETINNANNMIFNNLYCDTTRLRRNWLKKILIIGDMGSGKTEQINWIVQNVLSLYPPDYKIVLVFSNSLKYCLEHLPDADVIIIAVDDAIEYQSSQRFQSKENQLLAWKFYKIRHWYKHLTGRTNTFIITIFTTQRFKELDPRFRECHIFLIKNSLLTDEQNKELKAMLQPDNFELLERATILRNFNLPEYSKYYAYFINDRYSGFSEFPEPKLHFEKIDVGLSENEGNLDLMTKVLFVRYKFFRKYGKDMRWEDTAKVVGWRGTSEGLRIKFKRWKENNSQDYEDRLEKVSKLKYYKLNGDKEKKLEEKENKTSKVPDIFPRNYEEALDHVSSIFSSKYGIEQSLAKEILKFGTDQTNDEKAKTKVKMALLKHDIRVDLMQGLSLDEIKSKLMDSIESPKSMDDIKSKFLDDFILQVKKDLKKELKQIKKEVK